MRKQPTGMPRRRLAISDSESITRRPIRAARDFLSSVKPWGWALAYAVTFILYGFAYLVLSNLEPHSFYQEAVALEPRYQAEQKAVSRQLLDDLRNMFRAGAERRNDTGRYVVYPDSLLLRDFEIDSRGVVHIEADLEICDLEMGCGSAALPAWSYRIAFRASGRSASARSVVFEIDDVRVRNDRIWFHYPAARPPLSDDAINTRIHHVVEDRSVLFGLPSDSFEFHAPGASHELAGLIEEMRGWPSPATAEFAVRMFHLSATTITTTGYGDIVPLTSVARILTGSEALVGTVLLGLFIYSLPHHR
jgi:hypothetical protein